MIDIDPSTLSPKLNIPHADRLELVKVSPGIIHPNGFPIDFNGTLYTLNKWYNKNTPVRFLDKQTLKDTRCISLIQIWNSSFQHITFDTLPKIQGIRHIWKTDPGAKLLVNNELQAKICSDFWNIPYDTFIIVRPQVAYIIGTIYYPNFTSSEGLHTKMGSSGRGYLHSFLPTNQNPDTLLYISREGLTKRTFTSDDERFLVSLLQKVADEHKLQLTIINNPKSKEDILSYTRNAKLIVAIHGGAIGNLIYSNTNTRLLEIISDQGLQERPCYYYLTNALGLTYTHHNPTSFDFDGPVTINRDTLERDIEQSLI
jgi:capsular polysaccharide biosynthesis protein